MEVKLSPEIERKVREHIGGPYQSASDIVEEALKSFFGPETLSASEIDDLNRHIDQGFSDIARGDTFDGPTALKTTVDRLMRRRDA